MLKLDRAKLDHLEMSYPGISKQIADFENADLPACPKCDSSNTARVQCGIIGRTIDIAAATTKVHLAANDPPGPYFCNECRHYFNPPK